MVVAHPDDEVLWGGAALASDTGWGVVCLTNARTRWRTRKFREAMGRLGCAAAIFDVPDRGVEPPTPGDVAQMREILRPLLARPGIEMVLTHSPDGETGHRIHQVISDVVTELAPSATLHYFSFDESLDLARDAPDVWAIKQHALKAYFDPLDSAPGNDALHVRLSVHESPVAAADYVRPTRLLLSVYEGSTVPAGSITKGRLE